MSFYLKAKRLDLSTGGQPIIVLINEFEATDRGLRAGDLVQFCWRDICIYAEVDVTSTLIETGFLGIYSDIWEPYDIPNDEYVTIHITGKTDSIEFIKKKLRGEELDFQEMKAIYQDIADKRLSEIETTYFAATTFNPGFNRTETIHATRAMAETGDILDFGKLVVDKHSIGGIPSKGITPVLVPIIASFGLIIPNTSTRAISSPAGTSDILETLMPVSLNVEKMKEVVAQTGACMIWGGALRLAPADDILIHVERPLNFESYTKMMISIIAKKIATGVTHMVLDMPVGPGTKVHDITKVPYLVDEFVRLGAEFGIKIQVYDRIPKGPDGNGVGPVLEARDLLYILNRHPDAPKKLEDEALKMAGKLLELVEVAPAGKGKEMARQKLESGVAKDKFWEIAKAQGAEREIRPEDLVPGDYRFELMANKSGIITFIDSHEVVEIARHVGCPLIKRAGMYFHKDVGDEVKRGDIFATVYATSDERIDVAKEMYEANPEALIKIE
jgi:AMP phosphorylase